VVTAGSDTTTAAAVRAAVAGVADPEIPVLTIDDLGILRDVTVTDGGRVEVTITPTYSGCPAVEAIRAEVERVLADHGFADAAVRTVLAPAWTTDWITEEGRRKLADFGIAPPARCRAAGDVTSVELVRCPHCGSVDTRLLSRFGSTACKALRACNRCREPFDHFKPF
jgi:ring-1,2-phenylacetyl-CoA epoxidase subunit PaaD